MYDNHLDARRVMLSSLIPLNEILIDFHDRIKSITRGFGSMDYEPADYQESEMVKLDMLVNGEPMDAFSCIVHRSKAESRGRTLAEKLKEVIPRQQFQVKIQAAIGGKIVASETVSAFRKDVTAKCYGGDISRKRKLLEKQKEGKKRMKSIGRAPHGHDDGKADTRATAVEPHTRGNLCQCEAEKKAEHDVAIFGVRDVEVIANERRHHAEHLAVKQIDRNGGE